MQGFRVHALEFEGLLGAVIRHRIAIGNPIINLRWGWG